MATDPTLVGIINLTPDSFSDGGQHPTVATAVAHAQWLVNNGATILDIGAESTRPGAHTIPANEETQRLLPALTAICAALPTTPISVDTRKASVARAALRAGATIINDVSGLTYDPAMASVIASANAGVVLMHSQGDPHTMQANPTYTNVVGEVLAFLKRQTQVALHAGIGKNAIHWDVGFGFGKTVEHNLQLLNNLSAFTQHGTPVWAGLSRKSFLTLNHPLPPTEREPLTAAAHLVALQHGVTHLRVHNPAIHQSVLAFWQATQHQTTGR